MCVSPCLSDHGLLHRSRSTDATCQRPATVCHLNSVDLAKCVWVTLTEIRSTCVDGKLEGDRRGRLPHMHMTAFQLQLQKMTIYRLSWGYGDVLEVFCEGFSFVSFLIYRT